MSRASSKPLDKRGGEAAAASAPAKSWNDWLGLVLGIVLASAGVLVANHYELGRSAILDFQGARAQGWAESWPDGGGYRLSYTHPSGTLYGALYKKPISMGGKNRIAIAVAYLPDAPDKFQPAGLSYIPGASALTLFAGGMALILRARRRLTRRFQVGRTRSG